MKRIQSSKTDTIVETLKKKKKHNNLLVCVSLFLKNLRKFELYYIKNKTEEKGKKGGRKERKSSMMRSIGR